MSNLDLTNVPLADLINALVSNPQGAALLGQAQAAQAAQQTVKPTTKLMLNIKHGYLVPATAHNWLNADLKPFNGDVCPESPQEGLIWLNGGDAAIEQHRRRTGQPVKAAGDEPFDISIASKDEVIKFAQEQYGKVFDSSMNLLTMRKELRALCEEQ